MKILTILGARPQFIKAGSVSRAIALHNNQVASLESLFSSEDSKNQKLQTKNFELITEIIVHTGQHYDANMSDIFFDEMQIPKPNYFLGIGGKSHGAMTGQMIEKIEEVALKENPLIVMDSSFVSYQQNDFNVVKTNIFSLFSKIKRFEGNFIFLWHNSSFNNREWNKFQKIYEEILNEYNIMYK